MLTQECLIEIENDEIERALAFYIIAFGGDEVVEIDHVADGNGDRYLGAERVDLHIGGVVIALVSHSGLVSDSRSGEPIVLDVDDVRSATIAAWDAGATILADTFDMAGGEPACHLRDPFGLEWLLRERRVAA